MTQDQIQKVIDASGQLENTTPHDGLATALFIAGATFYEQQLLREQLIKYYDFCVDHDTPAACANTLADLFILKSKQL